jgi:hypothetical protein
VRSPTVLALLFTPALLFLAPSLGGAGEYAVREPLPSAASETSGWEAQVIAGIRRREYHFSPALDAGGEAFTAPNRSQGLRSRLSAAGLAVRCRRAALAPGGAASWELGLRLSRFGREGALGSIEAVPPRARDNRVEYPRAEILEWYINDERGLEQGFDLPLCPPGGGGPVVIEMELSADLGRGLSARLSEDRKAVLFSERSGMPVLRYGGLRVLDAGGAELEAELALAPRRLRILVHDAGAAYPLEVDPLLTAAAWSAEGNQNGAQFGFSVAAAGDVNGDGFSDILVGAPLYDNGQSDEGRAFLYLGSASGPSPDPAWTAESDQAGAWFGHSVAAAGDVNGDGFDDILIGAHLFDNGEMDEGRAFLYLGSAKGPSLVPDWTAESDQAGAWFGFSVAGAGDVNGDGFTDILIGAPLHDGGETNEGRAFLFFGSAAGPSPAAGWTAESDQAFASFGASVAGAGDVNGDGYADVLIGAYTFSNGQSNEGRAFLYLGSAAGPSPAPDWTAESDQVFAWFGISVAAAGDVNGDGYADILAGAPLYTNGQANEGRAFLYLGSAAGPSLAADWTAESDQASAWFGWSVSTAGDVNGDGYADVIAGARLYDAGEVNEGRIFLYLGSAAGLSLAPDWTAESDQAGAQLGISVAAAGDVNGDGYGDLIAGAYLHQNGESGEGRAFLYFGAAAGPCTAPRWSAESDRAGAHFGYSLAMAGDVNGDGYSDVLVGAPRYDSGGMDAGGVFLFLGSAAGLSLVPDWTAEPGQANARFGWSVAGAGDVNGDGYADVLVGAPGFSDGEPGEGRAFLYLGSPSGLGSTPAWTAEADQAEAALGWSLAGAGDVNGDGILDVLVGAPGLGKGLPGGGGVLLYLGSPSGLSAAPVWTAEAEQAGAQLGFSVAAAGDVDGDGFSDLLAGAPSFQSGKASGGRAFLYLGSANGPGSSPAWTAESDQHGARFASSLAGAGDVDGDGFSDVLVGAPFFDGAEIDEGRAFLYLGSAAGLGAAPAWTADGGQANAGFAASLAGAGDVDGDGFSDVLIGAPFFDDVETDEGRAFLYLGSSYGPAATPAWTAGSGEANARFGISLALAGDTGGDGFADILIGALSGAGGTEDGRAFLYPGNRGGLARVPRQARADGSAPIAVLGRSDSRTSFRLLALGRSPEGRGRVALEWEVKPLGAPFDGGGLERSAAFDTGAPAPAVGSAAALDELAAGLTLATPYRWRLRLASRSPFFPRSPWLSLPDNGRTETDLRTAANQPPLALCRDVVGEAGPGCQAGVAAEDVDGGSMDLDGDAIMLELSPPGPYGLGIHTVTLAVTDDRGGLASCEATVSVVETAAPPEALLELRLPAVLGPAEPIRLCLDLSAGEGEIVAIGARLSFDDDAASFGGVEPGSGLPEGWMIETGGDDAPGRVDLVLRAAGKMPRAIVGPAAGLEAACLLFERRAPGCGAIAFGFTIDGKGDPKSFPHDPYVVFITPACRMELAAPAAAGAGVAGPPVSDRAFVRGNVNNRAAGLLDIADVIDIAAFLFLGFAPGFDCAAAFDANDDGSLDITDVISLVHGLFRPDLVLLPPPQGTPRAVVPDGGKVPSQLGCAEGETCP